MKKNFLVLCFIAIAISACTQPQTFDITTFTAPKGWKKQTTEKAVQLSREDAANGTYCLITLYKVIQGKSNSKENFDLAWTSLVKEMVAVSTKPEMQPMATENGWEVQSGYAPFESDGSKGIALLVTSTSFEKMVNISILTNTDVYQTEVSSFLESIDLKKIAGTIKQADKPETNPIKPQQTTTVSKKDGFAFTTTNFDDGWTSTVQENWVEVTKGNIKVFIHYPNKNADAYNSVLKDGTNNAWNILVAPRYSNMSNFANKDVQSWESISFIEADLKENTSGKNVHVVFFKKHYSGGGGSYLEIITPDKQTYEREFGPYRQEAFGWEKVEKLGSYNKFAVAATDLKGKWTSNFTGLTQYVNAYTGANAGADSHASNQNFEFISVNSYKWDITVADGFVGNIKFQNVKSTGKFSMSGNWQVNFSDMQGKPKKYNVYFSCIKGARILWLQDTGYGDYTGYGKSE